MPAPTIQIKRGLLTELTGLALGEPGFTTDTSELYIGLDGTLAGNKFISASRYWRRESSGSGGGVNLYESTNYGSNFVGLRAPLNVPANVTYVLPATPIDGYFLTTNSLGILSWSNAIDNPIFSGSATVNGYSAIFNTTVFDTSARIINVGLKTDPPTNTTWDSAILFNYYKSGVRHRSGLFWNDDTERLSLVSDVLSINDEFVDASNTPIINTSTVSWAPLEIESLWINDCAGQSEVITCSGSERTLENITIDGGFY